MMTVFHLIRHAAHGQLGHVLTGRTPGVHLSDSGHVQAKALAARMSRMRLDAICSSPRLRARQTAAPIAAATSLECRVSPNLDEIDFGAWAGQSFQALEADPAWMRWNEGRDCAATPGGETMGDVAARAVALLEDMHRDFPAGHVALVSHGDVIKAMVCRYRGWPFQSVHSFEIAPASVTTVAVDSRGGDVLAVDETEDRLSLETVA